MTADILRPSGQACGACRFWRQGRTDDRGPDWGVCRRMPPSLPAVEEDKLVHVGVWPHTSSTDWCGEWQAAEGGGKPA
ncbi:MAG: hypothetical protein FJ284_04800 [Planctomycetes bacterium]|nr:hypothetical protein [Planctomycetota bacterium]